MNANKLFFFALLTASTTAYSAQPDFTQQIQISADHLSSIKENVVTYRNNVIVSQGSLQLHAEQLEIDASGGKGFEVYTATGNPVSYSQLLDDGQPVTAKALEIRYDPASKILILTGDAELTQRGSVVSASVIRYNIDSQELNADSGGNRRVTTIITPEEQRNP